MVRSITLTQAKALRPGQTLYVKDMYNANGTAMRVRVSGQPKVWKTRPAEVQVPVKRGMYESTYITQDNLKMFSFDEPKAVNKADVKNGKRVGKKKAAAKPKLVHKGVEIRGGVPIHHYGRE